MAPLTAEELLKHPEYNNTIWQLEPEKKGHAEVAKDRGGPLKIAYEVHGHGDRHLVVSNSVPYSEDASNNGHSKLAIICHSHLRPSFGLGSSVLLLPRVGNHLLASFRFSRIDRLNFSTRLMFLILHTHSTLSYKRLLSSDYFRPRPRSEPSNTQTTLSVFSSPKHIRLTTNTM